MTREELIAYDRWLTENKWGSSEIITPEQAADLYLAKHPLPPAEGAEAIVKKYEDEYDFKFHWVQRDRVIRMMREFAAQQQPTAEGAEEILRKNCNTCYSRSTGEEEVWSSVSSVLIAMQDFATLHAQRIAEKMVSERLREELIGYDKFLSNTYWGISHIIKRDEAVDEYFMRTINLKSRE